MAGTSSNTQKPKLVASFMQFLSDELGNPQVTEDAKESIEGKCLIIVCQCLHLCTYLFQLQFSVWKQHSTLTQLMAHYHQKSHF